MARVGDVAAVDRGFPIRTVIGHTFWFAYAEVSLSVSTIPARQPEFLGSHLGSHSSLFAPTVQGVYNYHLDRLRTCKEPITGETALRSLE